MTGAGRSNGSGLDDQIRLVIVNSPDIAAPLINALDVADVGAWMWVEAENALYFSPRVPTLLGLDAAPQADLLERFMRGIHPDDRAAVRAVLDRKMPAGPFEVRYRFTPHNGPLRWIEDRGRVERTAGGALVRQGGSMRDVTRDVGHQQEHREAEARLEALVNALPFGVWGRSGPGLPVTHQNAASIAWFGDLRGRPLVESPPEVRQNWSNVVAEVMTGQIVRVRDEHIHDGELRILQQVIAPVIVEHEVTGVVGVNIDVTEEERAHRFDALLTETTSEFASRSADTLDDALAAALERVGRFFGASVASLCEISAEQVVRVTHSWVSPDSGRDRPFATEINADPIYAMLSRLAQNRPVVVRSQSELPEGSPQRQWLETRGLHSFVMMPVRLSDGTLIALGLAGVTGEVVDWRPDIVPLLRQASSLLGGVLARVRTEARQKLVERRMQDTQKLESLGVLAGGIAHDFNNLLTAILGNASLLRADHGDAPSIRGPLEQIEGASRRAAELCKQMLAYAGRGRFALRVLDLNDVVRESQPLVRVSVPKKATLELTLTPDLPGVLADEAQLRQLLMSLTINAAEAIGEQAGTIQLKTSHGPRTADELARTVFSPQLPSGDYVSLTVSDTGEGIAPDILPRIFDPFFSTKFTGRGLGLAAVVGIVRAHKGALRVDSRAGEGSTFELLLPAHAEPSMTVRDTSLAATNHSLVSWRTHGIVLVVDDEFGVRDLVRNVLERAGLTVLLAEDGESAVEIFRQSAGDVRLVVLDLTMPGLDGREALAAMRQIRPDVPAILMSGYTPADIASASSHGFLQKPFTPNALRAAVRKALGE